MGYLSSFIFIIVVDSYLIFSEHCMIIISRSVNIFTLENYDLCKELQYNELRGTTMISHKKAEGKAEKLSTLRQE
jgi:hypothetical protein